MGFQYGTSPGLTKRRKTISFATTKIKISKISKVSKPSVFATRTTGTIPTIVEDQNVNSSIRDFANIKIERESFSRILVKLSILNVFFNRKVTLVSLLVEQRELLLFRLQLSLKI